MSARDRFKKANQNFISLGENEANKPTVVDDIVNTYNDAMDKKEEDPVVEIKEEKKEDQAPVKKAKEEESKPIPKSSIKVGRKKKYENIKEMVRLNIYFPDENYMFIKKHAWEHDSMNGFINHLIEEERKRRGE